MAGEVVIYVADAGSVSKGNFYWGCSRSIDNADHSDPDSLACSVADDLKEDNRVALGYECPLFVPCEQDATLLGRAREGECQRETGNRPFTAGAGASVLATGVQSLAWILSRVKELRGSASATTRWTDFTDGKCSVLVWEAFVSGSEKAVPPSHSGDAALAIDAFQKTMQSKVNPTRIRCGRAFSLAGAAILFAGMSEDKSLLSEPCVVLRPIFEHDESQRRLEAYRKRILGGSSKKGGAV